MKENDEFAKYFPLAVEVARKSIGLHIEPLLEEDAPKKLHDTVNKALEKMYKGKVTAEIGTDEAGNIVCDFIDKRNGKI